MPAVVKIDPLRRVVLTTCYGVVSDHDLVSHRENIALDPFFDAAFADVVDFTNATLEGPSEATLTTLALQKSLFIDKVPHIIVAPEPMYALASRFREMAKTTRPNLFVVRTMSEAHQILARYGFTE